MKGAKSMKHMHKFLSTSIILALVLASMPIQSAGAAGVRYAKPTASGTGNCSSWANACRLQEALNWTISGDEIWVMAGTHKPTSGTDRTATFQLKNGVAVYGGFDGAESARAERNPAANPTILSGDLNGDDGAAFANNGENSYHVVTGSGTNATAILDGFTVIGGNANGSSPHNKGGGMYNNTGSPKLRNVTYSGNWAIIGGGMYNSYSGPDLRKVTLSGNSATNSGGGMYNGTSNPSLTNVTLSGNSANKGGGMHNNNSSSPSLTNVIIANSAKGGDCVNEGPMSAPDATSANNLIEDEDANACGLTNGEDGNITGSDPKLSPLANYGWWTETQALQPESPAIDAGTNSDCWIADQRDKPRPDDGDLDGTATCDIGAVEFQRAPMTTRLRSQRKYDGWVLESGESTNKGGAKNNLGKVLQVGDDAADKQYRTILSFGTASIPDRAVTTKVILKVKKAGVAGKNPMSTHNGLVVDIKKGKFFTLPALQINDFQAKANKLKAGKFARRLYTGWYRSVLFKGAYPYINVKGHTQLRLRFLLDDDNDNVADILKLYSGNAVLAKRPILIVEYYVP